MKCLRGLRETKLYPKVSLRKGIVQTYCDPPVPLKDTSANFTLRKLTIKIIESVIDYVQIVDPYPSLELKSKSLFPTL